MLPGFPLAAATIVPCDLDDSAPGEAIAHGIEEVFAKTVFVSAFGRGFRPVTQALEQLETEIVAGDLVFLNGAIEVVFNENRNGLSHVRFRSGRVGRHPSRAGPG